VDQVRAVVAAASCPAGRAPDAACSRRTSSRCCAAGRRGLPGRPGADAGLGPAGCPAPAQT
jgi:hypothetical protein